MNILLIKQTSLVCDGIFGLLKRHFPNSQLTLCNQNDQEKAYKYGERANLIIIDIKMDLDIQELIDHFQERNKRVIVWIEDLRDRQLPEIFKMDLSGYIYYEIDEETLIRAINQVYADERFFHSQLSGRLLDIYIQSQSNNVDPPYDLLSEREWEVLQLLSKGYSNIKIANELFLSDKTVKNYVSSILHKLDVPDRTSAVLYALRKRWVNL